MLPKPISVDDADPAAEAAPDRGLGVVFSCVFGPGMANVKPDGVPNTGGLAIAVVPGLVEAMTDGSPNVCLCVVGVDVRVAKIDGPKGYDPAGLDPNAGDVVEDDPNGSTFDGSAPGPGTVLDGPDDAKENTGSAGVSRDFGGGEVEDSDAGTRTGISEDGGRVVGNIT